MPNSFEPLAALAPMRDAGTPAPGDPWFATLGKARGFQLDPRFGAEPPLPETAPPPDEADAVLADALADAEARGREAALAQMANEGAARAALKLSFQRLDAQLREELTQRLGECVVALCEATLAPMALDEEALKRRCKSAATVLGADSDDAVLRLHPEDIALLDAEFASRWTIVPAPDQARGTVHFDTPDGAVRDGPEEWRTSLREALGLC